MREPGRPDRRLGRVLPGEPLVHEARELLAARGDVGPRPLHEVHLVAGPVGVVRPEPREQLQQHDAEAVDVALDVKVTRGDVLRRGVAVGADDPGGDVRLPRRRPDLGEAEVRQLGPVVGVEEDVGGLEGPVYDLRLRRV